MDKYIITNFAYGTGPYLRTTELALAFNDELEKTGRERMKIIVPLVYGEKQKKVMMEEPEIALYADEIFFDEKLGSLLKSIFYDSGIYKNSLQNWVENCEKVSQKAHDYLSGKFKIISLSDGLEKEVDGKNIKIEINRSPRIRYDVAPAFSTTFGYTSEILRNSLLPPHNSKIDIDKNLFEKGIKVAEWVESAQKKHFLAYPGTFSWKDDYELKGKQSEILVPPISRYYSQNTKNIQSGIFTTVTGISGLERLYKDVKRMLHVNIYSNEPESLPPGFGIFALPNIITNSSIKFHVARSGWSSIWLSMLAEKPVPLVVPDFDPKDDPEIYFNNIAVEKMGIGVVYRGEPILNILKSKEMRKKSNEFVGKIVSKFKDKKWKKEDGGNKYCAKLIAKDFLENKVISSKV